MAGSQNELQLRSDLVSSDSDQRELDEAKALELVKQKEEDIGHALSRVEGMLQETTNIADATADKLHAQGAQLSRIDEAAGCAEEEAKVSRKLMNKMSFWAGKGNPYRYKDKIRERMIKERKASRKPKLRTSKESTASADSPSPVPASQTLVGETGRQVLLHVSSIESTDHDASLDRIEQLLDGLQTRAREFGVEARAQAATMDRIDEKLESTSYLVTDARKRTQYIIGR